MPCIRAFSPVGRASDCRRAHRRCRRLCSAGGCETPRRRLWRAAVLGCLCSLDLHCSYTSDVGLPRGLCLCRGGEHDESLSLAPISLAEFSLSHLTPSLVPLLTTYRRPPSWQRGTGRIWCADRRLRLLPIFCSRLPTVGDHVGTTQRTPSAPPCLAAFFFLVFSPSVSNVAPRNTPCLHAPLLRAHVTCCVHSMHATRYAL